MLAVKLSLLVFALLSTVTSSAINKPPRATAVLRYDSETACRKKDSAPIQVTIDFDASAQLSDGSLGQAPIPECLPYTIDGKKVFLRMIEMNAADAVGDALKETIKKQFLNGNNLNMKAKIAEKYKQGECVKGGKLPLQTTITFAPKCVTGASVYELLL